MSVAPPFGTFGQKILVPEKLVQMMAFSFVVEQMFKSLIMLHSQWGDTETDVSSVGCFYDGKMLDLYFLFFFFFVATFSVQLMAA